MKPVAPDRCAAFGGAGAAKRWYAVHTKLGSEESAAVHLDRQGFEVFLPRSLRTTRRARRITTAAAAFFPGYLFVRLDLEVQRWRSIDGTFGVRGLIKAHDRPLAVPESVIDALLAVTGEEGVLDLASGIAPGARVRVIGGPFADQLAIVDRMSGAERVRVLLSLMNRPVPLEIGRRALAAI
ncbi:MAG: transcription termination/antitermination protein NusG [Vitreimonas sp.]